MSFDLHVEILALLAESEAGRALAPLGFVPAVIYSGVYGFKRGGRHVYEGSYHPVPLTRLGQEVIFGQGDEGDCRVPSLQDLIDAGFDAAEASR